MALKFGTRLDILPLFGEKLYSSPLGQIALREFIQNSLDSNATEIYVTVNRTYNGGYSLEVIDNGKGISDIPSLILTLGGTDKDSGNGIGGFGIGGKLTMLCCDKWELSTISGTLTKEGFGNGEDIQIEDYRLSSGTRVYVELPEKKTGYGFQSFVKTFLSLTVTDCDIYLNGYKVEKVVPFTYPYGRTTLNAFSGNCHGDIWVRLNGLPMYKGTTTIIDTTTENWYENYNEVDCIFDVETRLSPYDEGYPLSTTREAFKEGSKEASDYREFTSAISEYTSFLNGQREDLKKASENRKINLRNIKEGLWVGGTFNKRHLEMYSREIATLKRYLVQSGDILGIDVKEIEVGISDYNEVSNSDNHIACLAFQGGKTVIIINPTQNPTKGRILEVVLHELTHLVCSRHDEYFTSQYDIYTEKIFDSIFYGEFRK